MFKHQMRIFSSQPAVKTEDVAAIKQLLYLTQSCMNAMSKMEVDVVASSQIFAYFILEKLPVETHAICEQSFDATVGIPTWEMVSTALKSRIKTLQAIATKTNTTPSSQQGSKYGKPSGASPKSKNGQSKSVHVATGQTESKSENKSADNSKSSKQPITCSLCSKSHILRLCPEFLNMTSAERKSKCEKLNLCFNCLAFNHRLTACQSSRNCFTCGGRHHTLLHLPEPMETASPEASTSSSSSISSPNAQDTVANVLSASSNHHSILLATAIVHVRSATNKLIPLRALIDSGSQATLITERAVQTLQLQRENTTCIITGVGNNNGEASTKCVHNDLFSNFDSSFQTSTCAFVLTKVTNILPSEFSKHEFDGR